MTRLLRLPKKVAGMAAEVARTSIALAEAVAGAALERVRGSHNGDAPSSPPPAARTRPAPRRPRPRPRTADADADAAAASAAVEAAAGAPADPVQAPPTAAEPTDPPPLAVIPEPTRGEAARIREEQREAEQGEDGPGPEIRIDEPWPGYKSMNAPEIIDRLKASDEAVKAVVLLYENSHGKRKTVLEAARG